MQQFVQTTLPKRDESSSTFRPQVPFPAKIPGTPAAVVVEITLEVVKESSNELVVGTELLVLILPNSSSDELRKSKCSRKKAYGRKDVPQKAEGVLRFCVSSRADKEYAGAPDYKILKN